jgi:hypothetical protein
VTVLRRYKYPLILLVLVALLVAVRAALPSIVKDVVNRKLQALEGYDGAVADIDLALWRGAYRIDGIEIVKEGGKQPTPFFSAEFLEFSVEWASLFKGSLVAEGVFGSPDLNLIKSDDERQTQLGDEVNWADRLEDLFPFRFNTVEIRDGTITFTAPGIQTQDALTLHDVGGSVSNLTNVVEANEETFADFRFDGQALGTAPLRMSGSLNPNAPQPTFDLNFELSKVQLPKINPWLRQYIKADAEAGDFELYIELAAADGRFKGYAKPLMHDVNILSSEEEETNPLRKAWEALVELAAKIFENQKEDQVAARIPLSGSIEDPDADMLATIVSVLRNAFVTAFARSLEGSISLRDVKKEVGRYGEHQKEDEKESKRDRDSARDDDEDRNRDVTRPPKAPSGNR